jgi:5-methylcytosine-specific restriction endonuclease McrA
MYHRFRNLWYINLVMIKKKRVTKTVKTRNAGTMTESAFWSFIRSGLRQKSRFWKPITQCKMSSRRAYKGPLKRQKFEYQCNECGEWFPEKKINVDHIKPAGSLNCANDLPGFVERLFCEVDNLQVLCTTCHDFKTKNEKYGSTS